MYIPSFQSVLANGLALSSALLKKKVISNGSIMDYEVQKCLDEDGNQRCSAPFAVRKSTCYEIKWSTDGVLSHTTAEVRDAGSNEIVFYRDTNGEWTPEKNELVLIDFMPKIAGQGNKTVDYTIKTCE